MPAALRSRQAGGGRRDAPALRIGWVRRNLLASAGDGCGCVSLFGQASSDQAPLTGRWTNDQAAPGAKTISGTHHGACRDTDQTLAGWPHGVDAIINARERNGGRPWDGE